MARSRSASSGRPAAATARLVGAKTVNGPSPASVSVSPAASTARRKRVRPLARSTPSTVRAGWPVRLRAPPQAARPAAAPPSSSSRRPARRSIIGSPWFARRELRRRCDPQAPAGGGQPPRPARPWPAAGRGAKNLSRSIAFRLPRRADSYQAVPRRPGPPRRSDKSGARAACCATAMARWVASVAALFDILI